MTEYLHGRSLAATLRDRGGPLDLEEALDLAAGVGAALRAVHAAGLLHRDVSSSNVVLVGGRAVLIDFGLARSVDDATDLLTRMVTPGFAPLEQYGGDPARTGPASDVYGLAATLYHALSGRLPAAALDRHAGAALEPLRRLRPDVPRLVADAVHDGLELDLAHRPATISRFLARLGLDTDVPAPPAPVPGRAAAGAPAAGWAASATHVPGPAAGATHVPGAAASVPGRVVGAAGAAAPAPGWAAGPSHVVGPAGATYVAGPAHIVGAAGAAVSVPGRVAGAGAGAPAVAWVAGATHVAGVGAPPAGPAAGATRVAGVGAPPAAWAVGAPAAGPAAGASHVPGVAGAAAPAPGWAAGPAAGAAHASGPAAHVPHAAAAGAQVFVPAPAVVAPPPGRRLLATGPVALLAAAGGAIAPVVVVPALVLVVLPVLATVGDRCRGRRRLALPWRLVRNVVRSTLAGLPALALAAAGAGLSILLERVSFGAAEVAAGLAGAAAALLAARPVATDRARFAGADALDAWQRRALPGGILAGPAFAAWVLALLVAMAAVVLRPDLWPLAT